jgi:hypothetical protein
MQEGDEQKTTRHRSSRHRLAAAAVFAAIVCGGCGTSENPTNHSVAPNGTATSKYLGARESLIRSSEAALPAASPLLNRLVAHVSTECPGVLRNTPAAHLEPFARYRSVAQRLAALRAASVSTEVERSLEAAEQEPQQAAVQRFLASVESIRWNDPWITELVRAFAGIERQRHGVPQLDVCRMIREWVSSGYRKPPAAVAEEPTGQLGRRWMLASAALGCGKFSPANPLQVLRALRRYQQPGASPTTRDVETMEEHLVVAESQGRGSAAEALGTALGLPATRPRSIPRRHRVALPELRGCSGKPELISEPVKEPAGA